MINLSYITTYFTEFYKGPMWHLPNALGKRCNISLFASSEKSYQYYAKGRKEKDLKISSHFNVKRFDIAFKIKGFVWPRNLLERLSETKVDVVHSNEYYQPISWQGLAYAKKKGLPFVFTQRTPGYPSIARELQFKLLLNRVGAKVVRESDHITSLTTFGKRLLVDTFHIQPAKVSVIPNGIDLKNYSNAKPYAFRKKYSIPEESFVVMHIGRVFKMKRIDILVRIFHEFRKQHPDSYLVVVGPEEQAERAKVDKIIKEVGARNIVFTGPIRNEDIKNAAFAADIIVLTSEKEPFGVALLDGMACSKPVIAFRVGGTPDIIENGKNGFLVEFGDIENYVKKLSELAEDKKLRLKLGYYGRMLAGKKFEINNIAEQYMKVYNEFI